MHLLRVTFAWNGRVDRATYLAVFGVMSLFYMVYITVAVLISPLAPNVSMVATLAWLPLSAWSGLALNAKRLRDTGRSPALAFLPVGVMLLIAVLIAPSLAAALSVKSSAGVVGVLIGGSVAFVAAAVVGIAMVLWLAFAATSPHALGERLALFGPGDLDG